ncbi:MAG: hypothetical protein PHV34_21905 [Verrucomicrobiae bacterium]|nr:hypothetical protein [Verrucomicrobiae bacterium]
MKELGWILFVCGTGMAMAGGDGFEKYEAMVKRNPFMSEDAAPKMMVRTGAQAAAYRFGGYVIIGNRLLCSIENLSGNKSYLLAVGQSADGVEVKEINVEDREKSVSLLVNGEILKLSIAEPGAGRPGAPMPPPGVAPGGPMTVVGGAPPAAGTSAVAPANPGMAAGSGSATTPRVRRIIVPRRTGNASP